MVMFKKWWPITTWTERSKNNNFISDESLKKKSPNKKTRTTRKGWRRKEGQKEEEQDEEEPREEKRRKIWINRPSKRIYCRPRKGGCLSFKDGPNTVSESTVSNTELSEFFRPHWLPGSELSEFLSAYNLCAKANSPSSSQNSPSLPRNSVRLSEFSSPKQCSRNSIPPVS